MPAMENGTQLPYDLMRTMHRSLGLDAMLTRATGERKTGEKTATRQAATGCRRNIARYARTTFTVEMARVSPSFALS